MDSIRGNMIDLWKDFRIYIVFSFGLQIPDQKSIDGNVVTDIFKLDDLEDYSSKDYR